MRPKPGLDIERVSFYDFFAANPFLLPPNNRAHSAFSLAGFAESNLSYQSSGQRFANARARLQFDLAVLVARGVVVASVTNKRVTYSATEVGTTIAGQLHSLYARAYSESATLVARLLDRLSDSSLRKSARQWLRAEALMIDLYETEPIRP